MGISAIRTSTAIVTAACLAATAAQATEGGLGRVIQGAVVQPKAGVVPDIPLIAVALTPVWFSGGISADRQLPIGGDLAFGINADVVMVPITALKVWNTPKGPWNFASAFTLPIIHTDITAFGSAGGTGTERKDDAFGIFDLAITPIIAGYHFSPTSHAAFNFTIWAPTGSYKAGQLANVGLGYWTFVPSIAYTKLWPAAGIEATGQLGIQFNTRNGDTDYTSGTLLTLDGLFQKSFKNGLGIGANVSWVKQISDDDGRLADLLNGFRGESLTIGPVITYGFKLKGLLPIDTSFRWSPSVYSRNRLSGDTFMFTLGLPLPFSLPKPPPTP